jgi:hypothetical protein
MSYVKIKDKATGAQYWIMEARTIQLYKTPDLFDVLDKKTGAGPAERAARAARTRPPCAAVTNAACAVSDLKGLKYTPLFDFFAAKYPKAFQMLNDPYVTADSGTGIVHQAIYVTLQMLPWPRILR